MCPHTPPCPAPSAPDREAAHTIVSHPEQGWSLLCNGVVIFEDTGELLPGGAFIAPHRPTDLPAFYRPVGVARGDGGQASAALSVIGDILRSHPRCLVRRLVLKPLFGSAAWRQVTGGRRRPMVMYGRAFCVSSSSVGLAVDPEGFEAGLPGDLRDDDEILAAADEFVDESVPADVGGGLVVQSRVRGDGGEDIARARERPGPLGADAAASRYADRNPRIAGDLEPDSEPGRASHR
jgi:hypothetical protein